MDKKTPKGIKVDKWLTPEECAWRGHPITTMDESELREAFAELASVSHAVQRQASESVNEMAERSERVLQMAKDEGLGVPGRLGQGIAWIGASMWTGLAFFGAAGWHLVNPDRIATETLAVLVVLASLTLTMIQMAKRAFR